MGFWLATIILILAGIPDRKKIGACGVSVQGCCTSLSVKAELGKTSQWESGDAQRRGM